MQNILIVGLGKSGTTGLYERIKAAVADSSPAYHFVFEPWDTRPFAALPLLSPGRPILSKITFPTIATMALDPDVFSHRVLIVRDPRDILISQLLFRPLVRRSVAKFDQRSFDSFIDALRRKETDPSTLSVVELQQLADEVGIGASAWRTVERPLDGMVSFAKQGGYQRVSYEDFVANRLTDLETYLALDLGDRGLPAEGWLGHITRSMGSGDWRNWFTEADVEHFRPLMQPFLDHFGYGDDWELASTPQIPAETSSAHILRKIERRHADVGLRRRSGELAIGPDELVSLQQMSDDGDPRASVRLAEYEWAHASDELGRGVALEHARAGARLGFPAAMAMLERHTTGSEQAFWREQQRFWEAEPPGNVTAPASARRLRRQLAQQRARVEEVESSTTYQIGQAVVDAVRTPGRPTLQLPGKLWRLARGSR